jgi:hypothetical protein
MSDFTPQRVTDFTYTPQQRGKAYSEALYLLRGEYECWVEQAFTTRHDGAPDVKIARKILRFADAIRILQAEGSLVS